VARLQALLEHPERAGADLARSLAQDPLCVLTALEL
jgi:hypothetical protein